MEEKGWKDTKKAEDEEEEENRTIEVLLCYDMEICTCIYMDV